MRQTSRSSRRSCLATAAVLWFAACATAPVPTFALADRRAIFEQAWQKIGDNYFDAAMSGVDWSLVRQRYAPLVDAAATEAELVLVLNQMVGELHHSHVAVMPPDPSGGAAATSASPSQNQGEATDTVPPSVTAAMPDGTTGLRFAWLDGHLLVTGLEQTAVAGGDPVRSGDEILSIEGVAVQDLLAGLRRHYETRWQGLVPYLVTARLQGPVGSTVAVEVASPAGAPRQVSLRRRAPAMPAMQLGTLGSMDAEFETRQLDGNVLYVHFTPCFEPLLAKFEAAMAGAPDAAGVILDLRDNPGGFGVVAMGIARHFLQEDVSLGSMRMRAGASELRFLVNPVDEPFRGPVVVITNGGSGSTAEILGAGLQKLGRVRVVGQTSMGAALPSTIETIHQGWRVQTPIADFTLPDGTSVEGVGVVPDVVVEPTRKAWVAGRDPYLEAALREIPNAPRLAAAAAPVAKAEAPQAAPRQPCVMDAAMQELLAQICTLPGAERLRTAKSWRMTSRMELMGMSGPVVITVQAPDRIRSTSSLPGAGDSLQVFDGSRGWSRNAFEGLRELDGEELWALRRSARLDAAAWRDQFASMAIVEKKRDGAHDGIVVRQTPPPGEGAPTLLFLDAQTLQPYRVETTLKSRMGTVPVTTELSDYMDFDGVPLPRRSVSKIGGVTATTITESLELDVPIAADAFAKPAATKPVVPTKK